MLKREIINKTVVYVKKKLEHDKTGHDWWHVWRVWKTATYISRKEKANLFIVEMAALLHDIADWKFYNESNARKKIKKWLKQFNLDKKLMGHIIEIATGVSFKGIGVKSKIKTKEGQVVQDADRLDALGAIGIARAFATGSRMGGRIIYDPSVSLSNIRKNLVKKNSASSVHHFYDKLLLLKDMMNTKTGKKLAECRHKFLKYYLVEFFKEWNQFK